MPELDDVLLRSVRTLDPFTGTDAVCDVLVERGRIAAAGRAPFGIAGVRSLDCFGLWLFPGLVDMHVHLRVPGDGTSETLATGFRAALAGGVTTLAMMPNTDPPLDSPGVVSDLLADCRRIGTVNALAVACVTAGRRGEEMVDFRALREAGAAAFSDDGSPVACRELFERALEEISAFDGLFIEHPEDVTMSEGGILTAGPVADALGVTGISESSESDYVGSCLDILGRIGGRLHLTHLSSPASVRLASDASASGLGVTCDVTPHHIALSDRAVLEHGTRAKMNPPLRSEESRAQLARLVASGAVTAVASDHAPHSPSRKAGSLEEAAFGITGLETLLPISLEVLSGQVGMNVLQVLSLLTTGPASVLGLPPPSLEPGSGSFVLFDPSREWTLAEAGTQSLSRNTPFMDRVLEGRVVAVWNGGQVYGEDGPVD